MDDHRTVVGVDDADLVELAGMIRTDEHRECFVKLFDPDRVVEGVKDGLMIYTVPCRARGNDGLIHHCRIVGHFADHKLTCSIRSLWGSGADRDRLLVTAMRLTSHAGQVAVGVTGWWAERDVVKAEPMIEFRDRRRGSSSGTSNDPCGSPSLTSSQHGAGLDLDQLRPLGDVHPNKSQAFSGLFQPIWCLVSVVHARLGSTMGQLTDVNGGHRREAGVVTPTREGQR